MGHEENPVAPTLVTTGTEDADLRLDRVEQFTRSGTIPTPVQTALDGRYAQPAGAETVTGAWQLKTVPAMYDADDLDPIEARSDGDGLTHKWNLVHDGSDGGNIIHMTSGPNVGAGAAMIAIGVRYQGRGYFVNNYGANSDGVTPLGGTTQGFSVTNLASITETGSFGFQGVQQSDLAPLMRLQTATADAATLLEIQASVAMDAGTHLQTWRTGAGTTLVGEVEADTGYLRWWQNVEVKSSGASVKPIVRVLDVDSAPSEVYMKADTLGGFIGTQYYRQATAGGNAFGFRVLVESDRMKIQSGQGAAAKGAETYATMIETRATAGTGGLGQMGFFGATPVNRPAAISSPSADTASLKTAVDAIRTALTSLGLTA